MRATLGVLILIAVWTAVSFWTGSALVPGPAETFGEVLFMFSSAAAWLDLGVTLLRGAAGLAIAAGLGFLLGLPAGRSRTFLEMLAPLVAAAQACPAIVWVSLVMVWVGVGSVAPVAAIALSAFPVMFLNLSQGVAGLNPRFGALTRVYRLPWRMVLRNILLPGAAPSAVAGLSYALSICWKVTATAEFIGSSSGVGAQIFWAYRYLNMPRLFAWTLVLILLGALLEASLIRPLRRRAGRHLEVAA